MLDLRKLSTSATAEELAQVKRGAKALAETADFECGEEVVVLTGPPRRSKSGGALVVSFRRPSGETDSILAITKGPTNEGAAEEEVAQMGDRAAQAAANCQTERALSSVAAGFEANMRANGFSDAQVRRVMARFGTPTKTSPASSTKPTGRT